MSILRVTFMLSLGLTAVIWDFRTRRIPNAIIVAGMLLGVSWQWCARGIPGLKEFLGVTLGTFLLLAVLHYFRMLGAGDVKLLMITGGFLGFHDNLICIFFSFLIAAVFSIAVLFKHRILKRRLQYLIQYIFKRIKTRTWEPYIKKGQEEDEQAYLHFSLFVFLGLLCIIGGWII